MLARLFCLVKAYRRLFFFGGFSHLLKASAFLRRKGIISSPNISPTANNGFNFPVISISCGSAIYF